MSTNDFSRVDRNHANALSCFVYIRLFVYLDARTNRGQEILSPNHRNILFVTKSFSSLDIPREICCPFYDTALNIFVKLSCLTEFYF